MKRIILITLSLFSSLLLGQQAYGQTLTPTAPVNIDSLIKAQANDSIIAQTVDSRKGYVARIPTGAQLDSARSGWNQKGQYERRVYVIAGAGAITFTTTVNEITIPEGATETNAYTYVERDSLTAAGTAWTRTYYLPTRSVSIEIMPYGIGMRKYIEERERIFNSFRWKPGAETQTIDIDAPPMPIPQNIEVSKGLGG